MRKFLIVFDKIIENVKDSKRISIILIFDRSLSRLNIIRNKCFYKPSINMEENSNNALKSFCDVTKINPDVFPVYRNKYN